MGGRVWVESVLGQVQLSSWLYRGLHQKEYEKRRIEQENKERIQAFKQGQVGRRNKLRCRHRRLGGGVAQAPQQEQQAPQAVEIRLTKINKVMYNGGI